MKKLFETLDGKQFEDEVVASNHENELLNKLINPRLKLLEKEKVIQNFKDGDIILAGRNFDEAGNSRGSDKLQGTKEKVMLFIAANNKYWNIGNQLELTTWTNDIIKL